MAHKRPFDDEVVDEGSSKHQRQDGPDGPIDEIGLCNDSYSIEGASGKSFRIGESGIEKDELELRQEHEKGSCSVIPREVVELGESDAPRSASLSHWATSSTSDDDALPGLQLPFYPGYFSFDHSVRPVINPDDIYCCLLDYPPRKRVPVGPDHQADIPNWGTHGNDITPDGSGTTETTASDRLSGRIVDGNLGGICILPSSEVDPLTYNSEKVGAGRVECGCLDQGSIRCVQQHVAEARDKLRRNLGEDTFMELGLSDMGEVVAEKWSEEEGQLFREVIYSNPASMSKKCWSVILSAVFPYRTKSEIVSYYFNVFMLRVRAEQNRCDPLNIDSDNDEWLGSDDGAYQGGESEEDEDSGIESPVRHLDGAELHQNGFLLHEDEHVPEDDGDLSDDAVEYGMNNIGDIARKSDPDSPFEHHGKKSDDEGENDVQDGSCTSSDSGAPVQGPRLKTDGCHVWNDFIIDSSDAKVWDDGYSLSCPKQSVDFLPTKCMIEEVFGNGDFESKGKRW